MLSDLPIFNTLNLTLQALASAMDEEEKLTNQLEAEQQQALQTAIEEEESWLKELAREENTVIDVETETETENELGVSSDPSVSSFFVWSIIFCLTSFSNISFICRSYVRRISSV